jgi:2-haloacid dehalogenase
MSWAGIERPGIGPFIASTRHGRTRARSQTMPSPPQPGAAGHVDPSATSPSPSVLVFDVNETLIDIESMTPLFEQIFGDPRVMREWFAHLVTYSMTAALARRYLDYFTLGQALVQMLAEIHQVSITDTDLQRVKEAMLTMPAHPDVEDGLATLRANGFRLVTLTNSPPNSQGPSPLEHAGLGGYFERQFSVDDHRTYKPDPAVYRYVCQQLAVAPSDCMMVGAHVWDNIGAQCVGFSAALITRPGNASLPAHQLPQPTLIAADLGQLAQQLGTAQ